MEDWRRDVANKWKEHLQALERLRLAEYLRHVEDTRRLMKVQFIGGVFRGLGMAVGFTVLGAVLVLVLRRLVQHNLPVIGNFLEQLLQMVEDK